MMVYVIIVVIASILVLISYSLALYILPFALYGSYQAIKRCRQKDGARKIFIEYPLLSIFLLACVAFDIYVADHAGVQEVDYEGSATSPSAFIRNFLTREKFLNEQIAVINKLIDEVTSARVRSPTEEATEQVRQVMLPVLADPSIQKALRESNEGKSNLQLSAEAHEAYARRLREIDSINFEKEFFAAEKRQKLDKLYRLRNILFRKLQTG